MGGLSPQGGGLVHGTRCRAAKPVDFKLLNHLAVAQNIVLQEQKGPESLIIIRDTSPAHYSPICQL